MTDTATPTLKRITVKPATGIVVRKPVGGYLSADGEEVNRDSFWLRRIADGDVTVLDPAPASTAKTSAKKPD